MNKTLRHLSRAAFHPATLTAAFLAFGTNMALAQSMPGTAQICGVKNWLYTFAATLGVGGLFWIGKNVLWGHHRQQDTMHSLVDVIPGLVLIFLGAGVGAYFGTVPC
jgi:hypothetical protein